METLGFEELKIQENLTMERSKPILDTCEAAKKEAQQGGQSLLPGITDEVTISQILTKLPWTTLWGLSLVSRAWRQAFDSRHVYDARGGPPNESARETIVAVIHSHHDILPGAHPDASDPNQTEHVDGEHEAEINRGAQYAISLYDPVKDGWNLLPDVPDDDRGRSVPFECACVVLNGRLYILGGQDEHGDPRVEMYMLDLGACRRVWVQRASMIRPRSEFACHALQGKIYAFGGSSHTKHQYSREVEVYDPEENVWRFITTMLHHHIYHSAVSLGGEIYVHGGVTVYQADLTGCQVIRDGVPNFAEVYNPLTYEWRKIEQFSTNIVDLGFDYALVVVGEQLYKLQDELASSMYDVSSKSWTDLPRDTSWREDLEALDTYAAVAVGGGEVLALICSHKPCPGWNGLGLLKSRGFGSTISSITWEKVFCPHLFDTNFQALHSFQL